MANPNIQLLGATYSGVTGVTLPKSGGGTATFPWVEGSETKTENGTYDVTNLAQLIVNVSGGGGATVGTATYTPTTNITSISFTVSGKPKLFVVQMYKNNTYINGSSSRYITSATNNGATVYTTALYKSGSTGREYIYSTSSWSYSSGTLTVTSAGGSTAGYFTTAEYRLIYAY